MTENRFTLIRVSTEDGVVGYSAGPAMGRERQGLGDVLGPYLIGEDATDIDLIQQRLREIGYLGWRNWWVEPAFWDIKGKLAGKPVYELLGAEHCSVPLYASTGEVKSVAARIDEVEQRYEEGFRTVKLRIHDHDPAVDERHVTRVAAHFADRVALSVDANQAWRVTVIASAPVWDLARAKRFADVCADAGLAWLEEPLPMDAYDELAALTAYARLPITGGELHTSALPELKMMIERRCYDVFQPDAMFTGGIAQTMQIAQLCKQHGLGYTPHTWTNGIGFAVNLQLYAASGFAGNKPLEYPINPPGWTVSARDAILREPFNHDRGTLEMPRGPGLGFEIDEKVLRKYGKRFFVMDKRRLIWFALRERGLSVSAELNRNKQR